MKELSVPCADAWRSGAHKQRPIGLRQSGKDLFRYLVTTPCNVIPYIIRGLNDYRQVVTTPQYSIPKWKYSITSDFIHILLLIKLMKLRI